MNVRKYLKIFNEKQSPARISLSYDKAINYDMYMVYIVDPATGEECVFDSYDGKHVHAHFNDEFNTKIELNPDELTADSFSGMYFYRAHQAEFKNLRQLHFFEIWKFQWKANRDNKLNAREKYHYRKEKQAVKDSMDVLNAVIELHLQEGDLRGVNILAIMERVHSRLWFSHEDKERMKREMNLWLNAFAASGELKKMDEYHFLPEGRAIMTRKRYIDDATKYQETTSIQKRMFWATFFSALAAAASASSVLKDVFKWLWHLIQLAWRLFH
ncbi:TPA: hypothetical protein ACT0TA_000351 [Klebsiella michiganensis]